VTDPKDPEQGELVTPKWSLYLELEPTEDARFVKVSMELRRPESRLPTYINSVVSTDMLFERVQADHNNLLRMITNDIHQRVVKPRQSIHRR